jgi:hypothetical protein
MKEWCLAHSWMTFFIILGLIDAIQGIFAYFLKVEKKPMIDIEGK